MAVLLLAEITEGTLALDATSKAVTESVRDEATYRSFPTTMGW